MSRTIKCVFAILMIVIGVYSVNIPNAPTSVSASIAGTQLKINATGMKPVHADMEDVAAHAVLVTSLTSSFQKAVESGNVSGQGSEVHISGADFPLSFDHTLDGTYERYYIGVAWSWKDKVSGKRYYSPWKIMEDDGVPKAFSTASGNKEETAYYRARKLPGNGKEIVIDATFSLKNPTSGSYKFELKKDDNVVFKIDNLLSYSDKYSDMKGAVDAISSGKKNVVIENDGEYSIYCLLDNYESGNLSASIISIDGQVYDTTGSSIALIEDDEFKDIINTFVTFTKIPEDCENPLMPEALGEYSGVLTSKFYSAAILDMIIAHDSPIQNDLETAKGVFSNYIFLVDCITRDWENFKAGGAGLDRLKKITEIAIENNKGTLAEPVYVDLLSTSNSIKLSDKEKRNIAFTNVYSRINLDFESNSYGENEHSGYGILLVKTPNIEIYSIDDFTDYEFEDKGRLIKADEMQRVIDLKSDTINLIKQHGLWIKAVDDIESEDKYTFAMKPIRKPILYTHGDYADLTTNDLKFENRLSGDVVKDVESNLMKLYPIVNEGGVDKVLKDVEGAEYLVHGNKRYVEFDRNYLSGSQTVKYELLTSDDDKDKVMFEQRGYDAVLEDTAVFSNMKLLSCILISSQINQVIEQNVSSSRICLKDATVEGTFGVMTDGVTPGVVPILSNTYPNLIVPPRRWETSVEVRLSGDVKVYTNESMNEENLLWSHDIENGNTRSYHYASYEEFKTLILKDVESNLYIIKESVGEGKVEIIHRSTKRDDSEFQKESILVNKINMILEDKVLSYDLSLSDYDFNPINGDTCIIKINSNLSENNFITNVKIKIKSATDNIMERLNYTGRLKETYDDKYMHNSHHESFYGTVDLVVDEVTRNYLGKRDRIEIKWDGRDNINNRILLEGVYFVEAHCRLKDGSEIIIGKTIKLSYPMLLSYGADTRVLSVTAQREINKYKASVAWDRSIDESPEYAHLSDEEKYELKALDWDKIYWLNLNEDGGFEWLANFSQAQELVGGVNNYHNVNTQGRISPVDLIKQMQTSGAFRFIAHHGSYTFNGVPSACTFMYDGKILANGFPGFMKNHLCGQKTVALDIDCNEKLRNLHLDDVLYAYAIGCNTAHDYNGQGTSTIAALVRHGVDCAIGTKVKIPVLFGVFFNRIVWDYLNSGSTIRRATEQAYTGAFQSLKDFLKFDTLEDVNAYFDGNNKMDTFAKTFEFLDNPNNDAVSNQSIIPARHGANSGGN